MNNIRYVAEIGSNHMGSLDSAIEHIQVAADVGATGVKFQLFRAATLYAPPVPDMERFEVPYSWLPVLRREAHLYNLSFSCTPFDIESCKMLTGIVDQVKISAYDLTYHALIREAAKLDVPIVLSTAMAHWDEIALAIYTARIIDQLVHITLLHGTACYPAPYAQLNLRAIQAMKEFYSYFSVGLSDHSMGFRAAPIAVALGATHIEKHFRLLDTPDESPDYVHSATPGIFQLMVRHCEQTVDFLGKDGKDGPLMCELPLYETCRRTDNQPLRMVEGSKKQP